ncbi:PRA1 family protein B2-like [Cynara cardunculus var. scolymus]|uniref:PRA1 family protein n=1 Tax=Cynara cardunculus var. scolymus TaxID=59895 RepID=A0A103YDD4_CYNCS|nr:PRA1 family protein B2-like [Cynara cardunculus var. scolymus]KVI07032.1 Prenylated rab acceptor PRA1 [Cynara cardunculus var. scolymus]
MATAKATATGPSRIRQSTTTATTQRPQRTQQIPLTDPDLRPLLSNISTSLQHSYAQRRPWFELIDRSTFSRPETISEATSRVRKNISYFRVNYMAVIALVLLFSLLSHPFPLFFLISLIASWLYFYLFRPADQPVFLFERTYSDREVLGILIVSTIVIVFLTGLVSLMISSLLFGLGIVCVHGAFRVPQDVFVEDQEPSSNAGFLSFLAVAAAAPNRPRV